MIWPRAYQLVEMRLPWLPPVRKMPEPQAPAMGHRAISACLRLPSHTLRPDICLLSGTLGGKLASVCALTSGLGNMPARACPSRAPTDRL